MKKLVALLLAVMLVLSVSSVAFAEPSHKNDVLSPVGIFAVDEEGRCNAEFFASNPQVTFMCVICDFYSLTADELDILAKAQKALPVSVSESKPCQNFFYARLIADTAEVSVNLCAADDCFAKIFVDGKWKNVPVTAKGNHIFTLTLNESGPVVLSYSVPSPGHKCLIPELKDNDNEAELLCYIHDKKDYTSDECTAFEKAQKPLADAVPEGMNCYLCCYARVFVDTAVVSFDLPVANDCAVKVYVDGAWEEVPVVANGNHNFTMTLSDSAPLAFFTK